VVRPALEVADIFRGHGPAWRQANAGPCEPRPTEGERCRTAALGGHVARCEDCACTTIAYNSCRNRHCPKSQRRHRPPGRRLFFLRQAPAALGLDSMDKVRRESGSAHTPVSPTRALASSREPTRPHSWAVTPPPPAGDCRKKETTKKNRRRPSGCFPRARGFDSAMVNAALAEPHGMLPRQHNSRVVGCVPDPPANNA